MGDIPGLLPGPESGPGSSPLIWTSGYVPEIWTAAVKSAVMAGASLADAQDIAQGIVVGLCEASACGRALPHEPRAWARVAAKRADSTKPVMNRMMTVQAVADRNRRTASELARIAG